MLEHTKESKRQKDIDEEKARLRLIEEEKARDEYKRLIDQKRELYFEAGALEVWVCSWAGRMAFYSPEGKLTHSKLCPDFPDTIVL